MTLPKKITPDRIRDSIVQVFYTSTIPFDPMIGYLYSIMGGMGLQYTNRSLRPSKDILSTAEVNSELLMIPQHFFFNEEIKIQLHQNGSLIFNCVNSYIGWTKYFSFIKDVILKLSDHQLFNSFNRIGIRYISEFPNIDILTKIKFHFEMSSIKTDISNGSFRLEWEEESYKIITNIGSKLPISSIIEEEDTRIDYVSLIDLDIIRQDLAITNSSDLFKIIDIAHAKEKKLFFELLKDDFLVTLNPEYN